MPQTSPRVERLSLPEMVYRELREAIMNSEFEPGQVLRQDEISRRFGVSRAPLREALPRLESEGLVAFNAGHGYSVAELGPDDITEIFRLRALIEQDAARTAAATRTAKDVEQLKALLDMLVATTDASDPKAFQNWAHVHFAFHRALISPSSYRRHLKIVDSLRFEAEPYMRANMSHESIAKQQSPRSEEIDRARSKTQHRAMFRAFRDGDGEALALLCAQHCEHTAERMRKHLSARRKMG